MKTLKLASLGLIASLVALSAAPARADLVIDASGSNGANGSNGRDGWSSGADGTSATRSTPGADAGNINIRLSDGAAGTVVVSGSHPRTLTLGSEGRIVLRATGGAGGSGGNGGDGAKGHTGSRGRDATRYSSGTDGGPGGRGGDGGNGTSGSNGGRGGTITVTVKEKDMRLLYLLATPEVHGGAGGARGRNGSGGAGGDGGPGGSSYSWQEPYQSTCSYSCTKTCHGSRSVSNGNGGSTTVDYDYSCSDTCERPCTQYRTESNSGGSYGSSGPRGSDGSAYLTDGARGADGSYRFVVEYNDGRVESYSSPFELVVTHFELASDFGDQFMEPGEKMRLSSITITNRGGMPSPTLSPIRLRADADSGDALDESASLDVRTSIAPGASITVPGPINAEVLRSFLGLAPDEGSHLGGPRKNISIGVSSEIVGINRYSQRLTAAHPMTVRYPVEISRVLGKRSIGQGDDYLFRWSVNNESARQLGSASSAHRHVRFVSSFAFASGRNSGTFALDVKGADGSSPGAQDVNSIAARQSSGAAQESPLMWAKLSFTDKARLLDEGTLRIVVEIEDPYVKGRWEQVDASDFKVKVGNPFLKTNGADVLLVTSPQTTEDEMNAWRELITGMNRQFDVWDVGIMGPLDIGRQGIAEHYAGGTIVILDDLIRQPGDEFVPADAMFKLAPSDFVELCKQSHISLFIFDRTGSFKSRAGGFGLFAGRAAESPMLSAIKVSAENFKSREYITGAENRDSLALGLSFDRKLEEAVKAARAGRHEAVKAYLDAILTDLALEQIRVRDLRAATKSDLVFLSKFASYDLSAVSSADGAELVDVVARLRFLADSQVGFFRGLNPWQIDHEATRATDSLLEKLASPSQTEKRVKELGEQADRLADLFNDHDKSRFFKFPRRWNGDYYRQAAFAVILRPVFDRTYTHKLELFNVVLDKERQALPAFN